MALKLKKTKDQKETKRNIIKMILKIQTPRSNVGMKEEKKKLKMPSSNSIIVKPAAWRFRKSV